MGLFDFLGGGKKVSSVTTDPRNDQRKQIDQFLANFISQYGGQYQPGKAYGKSLTAPASSFERQGLDQFLTQYLGAPDMSAGLGDVQSLLGKTISGGFDPGTSEYYRALRDASAYNRTKAIDQTNADLGGRGKFFSSEAVNKYGDINAQTANALNLSMADLANKERERSMAAVQPAVGLEQYLTGRPLQKASAATTIGSLPRTLEQNDLESQYQDFLRQQKELGAVVGASSGVSSTTTTQGYPNPDLQKGGGDLMSFITSILGSPAGQGALSSIGGAVMPAIQGAGASLAAFLPMLLGFCWVAAEVFGGWENPKTENCRFFIGEMAPLWFKNFYMKHGEHFAAFIKNKPILKAAIRPLFELFAELGKNEREVRYGVA